MQELSRTNITRFGLLTGLLACAYSAIIIASELLWQAGLFKGGTASGLLWWLPMLSVFVYPVLFIVVLMAWVFGATDRQRGGWRGPLLVVLAIAAFLGFVVLLNVQNNAKRELKMDRAQQFMARQQQKSIDEKRRMKPRQNVR